jgi:hypothetical protein
MSKFNRQNGNHILVTMIGACLKVFSKGFAKFEGGTADGKCEMMLAHYKTPEGKALRARLEKEGINDHSIIRLVCILQSGKTGSYVGGNGKTYYNWGMVSAVVDYDVIEVGHGANVKYVPYQAPVENTQANDVEKLADELVAAATGSYTAEEVIE